MVLAEIRISCTFLKLDVFVNKNKNLKLFISALLTSGTTNVFVLDWEGGAIGQWAESFIGTVSQNAIEFIRLLVNRNKVSVARLHLIGFDMGAHIVGLVGRGSTHTIARITGECYFSFY